MSVYWLKCPEIPALNTQVTVRSFIGYTRPARQGIFDILGSSTPVVVDDTRGARRGQVAFRVPMASRAAMDALYAAGRTLLLQFPLAAGEDDLYLRFVDLQRQRSYDNAAATLVMDTLDFVEVDPPPGAVVAFP